MRLFLERVIRLNRQLIAEKKSKKITNSVIKMRNTTKTKAEQCANSEKTLRYLRLSPTGWTIIMTMEFLDEDALLKCPECIHSKWISRKGEGGERGRGEIGRGDDKRSRFYGQNI